MTKFNPEQYASYNAFQKKDAYEILKDLEDKMFWRKNSSVIDIGCGDGLVTATVLTPILPKDYSELVATDISKDMLNKAKTSIVDTSNRTKFMELDIAGNIPECLEERFDFAFSNYVLHFVTDQEKALQNVYNVLSAGGNFVLIMFISVDIFGSLYEVTSKEKWSDVRKHIENNIVKLYLGKEPEKYLERILQSTGFKEFVIRKESTYYDFKSLGSFRKLVEAANFVHLQGSEETRHQEFLDEYMQLISTKEAVEILDHNTTAFRMHYFRLVIYGKK